MDSSSGSTTTSAPAQSTKSTKKRYSGAGGVKTGGKSKAQKKNLCLTKPALKRLLFSALAIQNGTIRISKNAATESDREFKRDLSGLSSDLFVGMRKNKITQAKRIFVRQILMDSNLGYLFGSDIKQKSPFFESTK